jgi:biopolymer transport protein ExbB
MTINPADNRFTNRQLRWISVIVWFCFGLVPLFAHGQEAPTAPGDANVTGDEELVETANSESPAPATSQKADAESSVPSALTRSGIPQPLPLLWDLALQGGLFMIPIALCSIVVVAFAIERRAGLRKGRIMPRGLLVALQKLNLENNGIDPRLAYDVCQKYRSPMANVIQAAILKVGRPQAELEKAVEDAVSREADDLAHNIRPINVAASIAPLIGLLGTVQGMIMAFMVISTTTATGAAKGQELAQGIYTALVTTFAGLCVAIPGIVIANMLERRIERILRGMEDVFNEIVPLFERFEGKWRVTRKNDASGVVLRGTTPKVESSESLKSAPEDAKDRKNPRSAVASKGQSAVE